MKRAKAIPAAIGFRVKTGRAIAALLAGPATLPRVLERRAVQLSDPKIPESGQPYHAALELSEAAGAKVVRRCRQAVQAVATREVSALVKELGGAGHSVCGIALVVGSDTDPAKLGNPHVRAHASEGRLFREILEAGAAACSLPTILLVEREAYIKAAAALKQPADELKRAVAALGRPVAGPWRSEEKMAALGAWVALANFR